MDDEGGPLRDYGSFNYNAIDRDDIEGHHTENWQQEAMNISHRIPRSHRKRHHRHHRHRTPGDKTKPSTITEKPAEEDVTPPSERVKFLLGNVDDDDEEHEAHPIFCEMDELKPVGDSGEMQWRETARWIKFEEDVEEGGDRWSKPFVATLSLHSLFELRKSLLASAVMLDMDASNLFEITELAVDQLVAFKQLPAVSKEDTIDILLSRHRHQHDKKHHHDKGLPFVRSLADIKNGSSKNLQKDGSSGQIDAEPPASSKSDLKKSSSGAHLGIGKSASSFDSKKQSQADLAESASHYKFNQHYAKKIPAGAEAANILVGEVDFLEQPVVAFIRLGKAVLLGELTEVPVPTRFLFMLLGPKGNSQRYREVGRSIATLMSDEVFHELAYKARNREDLIAGIDEFLDQVTVLPPGEWDPTIRIEPPKSVPSQEGRKKPTAEGDPSSGLPNGLIVAEPEEDSHADPTLERTGRIFGGLIQDIRRKIPWYLSDFRDGIALQCLASFGFIYFACLTPIITFGGLLGAATDNHLAAMESLVSGAICGISYHLFSGQPLTIIGSTGPVLVFETIVYGFCKDQEWDYLAFRFWIGIWMSLALFMMVMFDLSALVRYITRFTEESFAMLIALIFIVEAFKKLFHILDHNAIDTSPDVPKFCYCVPHNETNDTKHTTEGPHIVSPTFLPMGNDTNSTEPDWASISDHDVCHNLGGELVGSGCDIVPDVFFFSCVLFIGTFLLSYGLKFFRNTRFLPNLARSLISDFAVFAAILAMVGLDAGVGISTPKLLVPEQFRPTRPDRGWVVNPFSNPAWTIPAAILPSLLATILIFMDQQITAVIVNRKENKLKKGGGYHLDLLCIVIQIVICSLIGTPWFVAATVLSINHVRSLTRESETSAPGERPKFLGIRENRLTGAMVFVLVGLSALLASVLKYIPMPVLFGVFLYMGVSSVKGIQLMQRFLIIFMPAKYQPDYIFLRHVPLRRVHLFTFIQVLCLAGLWVIKSIKMVSIIFPIMVLAMCFIRKALDYVFTRHELKWLDDIMPESHKREKEEKKKKLLEEQEEHHIAMTGGAVHIPLKDGKHIEIPTDSITYDPVSKKLAVNEEMSKTAIWDQLDSTNNLDSKFKVQGQLRSRKPTQEEKMRSSGDDEPRGPVTFNIGEESHETAPDIRVDPPSKEPSISEAPV